MLKLLQIQCNLRVYVFAAHGAQKLVSVAHCMSREYVRINLHVLHVDITDCRKLSSTV